MFVGIPLLHEYGESFIRLSFCPEFKRCLRLSHIEPHITLKAPQEVSEEELPQWRDAASQIVSRFDEKTIKVDGSFFITPFTLALEAESKPLCSLHLDLVSGLRRFNSPGILSHEGEDFVSHITVGRATKSVDQTDRKALTDECSRIIKPRTLRINKVRLFIRRSLQEGYETMEDVALKSS